MVKLIYAAIASLDVGAIRRSLPPSGLLQVRLVWAEQPVRSRWTLVDRFLASSQRRCRHDRRRGGPRPRDPRQRRRGRGLRHRRARRPLPAARVPSRKRPADRVGEGRRAGSGHRSAFAGEQDATVRDEDRGVADAVRLMLDDLARRWSAVRGQRGDEPDHLERDARRSLRRHPVRPLSGFTGSVGAGGGGIARHVGKRRTTGTGERNERVLR